MPLVVQMLVNAFGAYTFVGLGFAAVTAAQMLANKEAANAIMSPFDQVLTLATLVVVWPAVLLAMWDDNQDGPWRG
jgi:hypothetical protein